MKSQKSEHSVSDQIFTAKLSGELTGAGVSCRCVLGRGGVVGAEHKKEGDGASPLGTWTMRRVFYRPDRLARPKTGLPVVSLRPSDGWCDEPNHPLYNRPVTLPFEASHEVMWREDGAYDIVVELGYNDDPVETGRGSAIFFHLAKPGFTPTEGCVAVNRSDMLQILEVCGPTSLLAITI